MYFVHHCMVWSWECSTETWGQGSETKRQKLSYNPALSVKYICSVFSNSISMHWATEFIAPLKEPFPLLQYVTYVSGVPRMCLWNFRSKYLASFYYIILKMPILSGSRNTVFVHVSLNANELLPPTPFSSLQGSRFVYSSHNKLYRV